MTTTTPDDDQLQALLAAPTLGAWRRANGVTGMCDTARIALAAAIIHEAQRQATTWRLIGILDELRVGQRPDVIARRLHRLALDLDPTLARPTSRQAAA